MGLDDKIENAVNEAGGKAKEQFGKATNDPDQQAEGHKDQAKAEFGKAKENIKDAFD